MLRQFAMINEAIEYLTPTKSVSRIARDWRTFSDPVTFTKLMCMEYPVNNLGLKKAMVWLSSAYECFPDELEDMYNVHGDIGTAVNYFSGRSQDSSLTIKQTLTLLELDCSKKDSTSFKLFKENFLTMSSLEQKWFVRFWLRTPRNGMSESNVIMRKVIARIYEKEESHIKKLLQSMLFSEIVSAYERGDDPQPTLEIGKWIAPMLAKVVPESKWPKTEDRFVDLKYDGNRYQIHLDNNTVIVFNRKGKIVNDQFPDVITKLKDTIETEYYPLIIDTEIYPIEKDGSPAPHKMMGKRVHKKDKAEAVKECPVEVAIFDVMLFQGKVLVDSTFRDRLDYLEKLPHRAEFWLNPTDTLQCYSKAIGMGYEGIMVKDLNAVYQSGKRSNSWAKHKPPRFEFDVVVMATREGDGKRSNVFASYDIGVLDGGDIIPVGSVGTGFSDAQLLRLTNDCRKIVSKFEKGTYHLMPRIVFEVTCDLVTRDADGNMGLRFPRLIRIRDDKPVSECNTVEDLMEVIQ